MNNSLIKKILNYGLPVIIFIFISYAYFPGLLEGKSLMGHDTKVATAKSSEIEKFRKEYGEEPLWTNAVFSGMPAYFISTRYTANLTRFVNRIIEFGKRPSSYLIIAMLSFYVLLISFGVNPWLSMIGALAFGFTTNTFVLLQAGHMSKVHTYAYMGGFVAGFILTFRGKRILGAAMAGVFLSLMILSGHPQMTYYTGIIVLIYGIFELVEAIKQKTYASFLTNVGLLLVAVLLAFGSNFSRLYTQYEYLKYSTRGESELTKDKTVATGGLDKDYILSWSNSVAETFALMIPDFRAGGAADYKPESEFTKQVLPGLKQQFIQSGNSAKDAQHDAERQVGSLFYWGGKPTTDGPMYHGAVICFLFILGLFLVKGKYKWWLLVATVLSIMLSWGKYFPALSHLFIDYFPMYDKFRDVTMLMVIAQFTMPLLALLGINALIKGEYDKPKLKKALYWSFGLTGGLALIFALIPSIAGNFSGKYDSQLPANLLESLRSSRIHALRSDAFRAFMFIAVALAGIWAWMSGKFKKEYFYTLLAVLVVADLWFVDQRYLSNKDLVRHKPGIGYEQTYADKIILKDKDPDFKVLNLSVSTFNDASTSNYHFSIGGYDGAKMRRYQELIEHSMSKDMQYIAQNIRTEQLDVFQHTPILNMLNTKYVILSPQSAPAYNKYAYGHAWFVTKIELVPTADAEILAMKTLKPDKEAVVNEQYSDVLGGFEFVRDTSATIKLEEYRTNYLKYKSQSKTDQLAVFSEIYYPKGWDAFIDGKPVEHVNADYVLRALPVRAGEHVIEFRFEPKSYSVGNKVSFASSLLLILLLIGAAGKELFRKN
ncbi:YfhO family protein [Saccharicrinis sp. FJH54]|uniref:YfhO family protein n=1 Tax=Saccharicrinis sp. FJH54 TaxID=3344665 RepID=UPI0035D3FE0B